MSPIVRLSLPAAVVAALLACTPSGPQVAKPAPTPEALVGTPLATVNGNKVGSVAWEALVDRKQPADANAGWSAEEKKGFLDEAIEEELLFQEAFARGIYQDPKVRRILVNLLLRGEIYDKVTNESFTDEEMLQHYQDHKDDYIIPEKVQIKRIFVAVTGQDRPAEVAKGLIDKAYAAVKADPNAFRDVAAELSEDPFARRGGDIGFVDRTGRAGIPQSVIDRAFTLEEGQMTEPFEDAGGWNILYVPTRRERVERPFETMKGSILRRMKNERYEQLAQQFAESLKAKASIAVDEAALSGWTPPVAAKPGANLGPGGMAPPPPHTVIDREDAPTQEEMDEAIGLPPGGEGAGEQ